MFKFRGKRLDNGEWVVGTGIWRNDTMPEKPVVILHCWVMENGVNTCYEYRIDPATLGASWGAKDKNGREVFSNHKLRYSCKGNVYKIEFDVNSGSFYLVNTKELGVTTTEYIRKLEIIEEE